MEFWKDVPGYEGSYQISNLGNIKSLARIVFKNGLYPYMSKNKKLKLIAHNNGYLFVNLSTNRKRKTIQVHKLMAITFFNHKPNGHELVVDHINNIKTDNRIENLQLITHRENLSKDKKNCVSKHTGAYWSKKDKKWYSSIRINGKSIYLGQFKNETEAANAYQEKLRQIS